jgi:hypothetical protein
VKTILLPRIEPIRISVLLNSQMTHINQINNGNRQVNSAKSIVAGPPTSETARFTVAISSSKECKGSCTAVTLCPAFSRMGITLLHEEPSAQSPWTSTMFGLVALVVVGHLTLLFPCPGFPRVELEYCHHQR